MGGLGWRGSWFFFSSRRRHTRWPRDWSSDVCSSDLWEFVKIGNCGSPIETDAGWLVITHGVGPMRKYCIGAMLLDLQDPAKVIGRLNEPLLEPSADKRDGYVPNVVDTCGALVHGGRLVLPYGLNDTTTTIVTVDLETLLTALNK